MNQSSIHDVADKLLYRPEEAAYLLSLGRSTVFRMIGDGELPSVRIGRSVRVPHESLLNWISAKTKEPSHGTY